MAGVEVGLGVPSCEGKSSSESTRDTLSNYTFSPPMRLAL